MWQWIKRIALYLFGMLVIALGINFTKMASLGIAPVSSIPRALEVIFGLSLGTMVIVLYCFLVLLQLIVAGKNFRWVNLLGIPIAIVFGFMVDLLGTDPNAFGHLLVNFPRPATYWMKLLYLLAGILIIGIGVYLYLKPNLIPMPAEGLAQVISEKYGMAFGNCKTLVDIGLIVTAALLQLIFLGGFSAFVKDPVVVREGTLLSALLVGQVVKFLMKLGKKK